MICVIYCTCFSHNFAILFCNKLLRAEITISRLTFAYIYVNVCLVTTKSGNTELSDYQMLAKVKGLYY